MRAYRVRRIRQVEFVSAGRDSSFRAPRGHVGMQGKLKSYPADSTTG
jgi:hypothetical protein